MWVPALITGKFLHGVTVTIVHIAVQKMTVETVPKDVAGVFVPVTNIFMATGYTLILGSGLILPKGDYSPGLELSGDNLDAYNSNREDQAWRFVYIFPVILNVLMLLGYFIFIRAEPILHALKIGDDEQALSLIDKVYDSAEDRQ